MTIAAASSDITENFSNMLAKLLSVLRMKVVLTTKQLYSYLRYTFIIHYSGESC